MRVWQSLPAEHAGRLRELGLRSRIGDDFLRLGYLKTFMDGTLGSQTAWMLDGSGVCITSGEELAELIRAAARRRLARGRACDRRPREPRGARRVRGDPRASGSRSDCASGSSTRSVVDPDDLPRFAELGVACSVQFSHAPSDRDLAERFWGDRLDGTYAFGTLLRSGAVVANGSDAPVEELDPLAGIAAGVLRTIDGRAAWRPEEAVTVEEALHATTVAPPGSRATSAAAGSSSRGSSPTSSCSTATRWPSRPDELREVQVVATMVGGRWVHNPPPWD